MSYFFHKLARKDLDDAIAWYEEQSDGLGISFLQDVRDTIQRIILKPEGHLEIAPGIRRCKTGRFKYAVIYRLDRDDRPIILAIMHLHRDPDFWRNRLGD